VDDATFFRKPPGVSAMPAGKIHDGIVLNTVD